jgi:GntR family transcriptional regulator
VDPSAGDDVVARRPVFRDYPQVRPITPRIASGEYAPGAHLPPGKDLAATYGAEPNTVLSAIRALRDQGLVTSQQGRGTFVRDDAADVLRGASSPEFKQLSARLDDMASTLQTLDDRVRHLEDAVPPTPAESGRGAG